MSYDLFFRWRNPAAQVLPEVFLDYFRSRPLYEVSEVQAWYSNELTGVYFSFDVGPDAYSAPENPTTSADLAPVAFNINYIRPHFFGLEAEPELSAFVETFDLLVSDPQSNGMGEGEYSPGGFLAAWNTGNFLGYCTVLAHQSPDDLHALPTSRLEAFWRWNSTRDSRQEEVGDSVYVPRIFLVQHSGTLCTAIAWGDLVPILLPRVDLLLVPRNDLAPRKLFRRAKDIVLVEWHEVESVVESFPGAEEGFSAHRLFYTRPPRELKRMVRSRKPPDPYPKGIAPSEVLNEELLEEARRSGDDLGQLS